MKSKVFALCASFTLMLAGCGPEPVKATGVELDKTSATMIVGDTLQLNATVAPENATDKAVTWSASGDGIVSVENGLVTALKAGESTVTVTTHDGGFTATCAITVNNPVVHVTGVSLDVGTKALMVGEEHQLVATVAPADATNKNVTWSVTGEAVTVNNGLVTAVKKGESTVTVKTEDGNKTASCVFTVSNPPVSGVELNADGIYLCAGETYQLTATVSPDGAEDKSVTWSVTGSAATVSDTGLVTATALGESIVTVTTTDGSKTDTCTVTVVAYPEGTFMAKVSTFTMTISLGNALNGLVAVRVSTADINPTGIEYNRQDGTFEIPTTGKVMDTYAVGKITGKYDAVNDKLIEVNSDGDLAEAMKDLVFERPEDTFYDFNKDTAALQAQFKRRYRNNNAWNVDSSNTDRIVADNTHMASGSAGLTVRPCTLNYQGYCFNLQNDFAATKSLANVQFWVYNPCEYDISFRIYYFKQTGLNGAGQVGMGEYKAKANTYTYISRGFTKTDIYNFSISVWTEDHSTTKATTMSAKLVFDDLLFF